MGLVQKILFVLQIRMYADAEGEDGLINVLKVAITQMLPMGGNVGRDQVAKPVISYLAANLHPPGSFPSSILLLIFSSPVYRGQRQFLALSICYFAP
jgi:hypothetical protein